MEPEDLDIYFAKDDRNLKAKGISNKSFNAKEVARRETQTQKRAAQGLNQVEEPAQNLGEDCTKPKKHGNGKAKKEKPKDEPFVDQEQQLGKAPKKAQKNMRRQ